VVGGAGYVVLQGLGWLFGQMMASLQAEGIEYGWTFDKTATTPQWNDGTGTYTYRCGSSVSLAWMQAVFHVATRVYGSV
jgi:hypothetical protein